MSTTRQYSKTNCLHCAGGIEFDAEHVGSLIDCPHCGKETPLTDHQKDPTMPSWIKKNWHKTLISSTALGVIAYALLLFSRSGLSMWESVTVLGVSTLLLMMVKACLMAAKHISKTPVRHPFLTSTTIVLFIVGAGLVVDGCRAEHMESLREDGSAIRQIVGVLKYGFGFILLGLSGALNGLSKLATR